MRWAGGGIRKVTAKFLPRATRDVVFSPAVGEAWAGGGKFWEFIDVPLQGDRGFRQRWQLLSLSLLGLFLFLFSLPPLASVLGWILSQGVCVQGLLLKTGQTHFTGEDKFFTFSELSPTLLFNFRPSSGHP